MIIREREPIFGRCDKCQTPMESYNPPPTDGAAVIDIFWIHCPKCDPKSGEENEKRS